MHALSPRTFATPQDRLMAHLRGVGIALSQMHHLNICHNDFKAGQVVMFAAFLTFFANPYISCYTCPIPMTISQPWFLHTVRVMKKYLFIAPCSLHRHSGCPHIYSCSKEHTSFTCIHTRKNNTSFTYIHSKTQHICLTSNDRIGTTGWVTCTMTIG